MYDMIENPYRHIQCNFMLELLLNPNFNCMTLSSCMIFSMLKSNLNEMILNKYAKMLKTFPL